MTVAVVVYTLFDELLFPLFQPLIRAWAKSTPAWQTAVGWVRGVREWLRGVIAALL